MVRGGVDVAKDARPLLFVDIDGVLNPYGPTCPDGYDEHRLFPEDDEPVRICPWHGVWLRQLAEHYELKWATSWNRRERAMLAGLLSLPEFHGAVRLPSGPFDPARKVPAIDDAAGARPLAWIDDMLTPEAWAWAQRRSAPTLLLPVDPPIGLTRRQVQRLLDWAETIHTGRTDPPRWH